MHVISQYMGEFMVCKYSIIIGPKNSWIIMNYFDYRTDDVDYEHINITIIDGGVTNMFLNSSK